MDFRFTDEQQQIVEMVAVFVDEGIIPIADEIDKPDEFPHKLVDELADLGLMGMPFSEEYGGSGLDYHACPAALEEISRAHLDTL